MANTGEKITIRLASIDCPEKTQTFGLEAKEYVINQILYKTVYVTIQSQDRYGRKIASIKYENKDLASQLLIHGLAWHYKQYSTDTKLSQLEQLAKEKKIGLWQHEAPVAPWQFRRQKR